MNIGSTRCRQATWLPEDHLKSMSSEADSRRLSQLTDRPTLHEFLASDRATITTFLIGHRDPYRPSQMATTSPHQRAKPKLIPEAGSSMHPTTSAKPT
ncbi:hypothetical protein AUEXF2481DRAFT_39417 [Aureobasidium subglaciale EXF-2481]|uniref:Uncharacterized protein n=1 Tax=Aureobasidium subglaciale (strain EXF-2481) TaxID=1043005 RepID=A0A074YNA1_AURSE|nr:uncharacterized protein AUEXF2481DRAFT_39417 [Aureobasidium subglaciale EXF-2481]KEQ95572.1 hypothetical protein AUEXF2481DRAFT_39417 [Aureobasidium subglaciale EXF-2481]